MSEMVYCSVLETRVWEQGKSNQGYPWCNIARLPPADINMFFCVKEEIP